MMALGTVVYMGSDPIGLPVLRLLAAKAQAGVLRLAGVISQPDRPSGRGKKLQPNAISACALAHGWTLLRPEKPRAETVAWLRDQHVDLIVVMAYGHILKNDLLVVPRRAIVNLHASLLPAYRGASPVETAVARGETQTGVSLMRIVQRMDAGAVCDVARVPVSPSDTGGSVREKLAEASAPLVERNLDALLAGQTRFVEQDEAHASYCRKLTRADGQLDFAQDAVTLAARIRGLDPWPGCFVALDDGTQLKARGAQAVEETTPDAPGTILGLDGDALAIATGRGTLRIERLQRPGGKLLPAPEFLRGYSLETGTVLQSMPMPDLVCREG
ncbi:MAG: methionyl-tRNA formyltransferase [Opitutales bacterium]